MICDKHRFIMMFVHRVSLIIVRALEAAHVSVSLAVKTFVFSSFCTLVGRACGWTDGRMNDWLVGWMNGRTDVCVCVCV